MVLSKKRQQRANALANSNAARKRKSQTKEAIRKRRTRKWKQWKINEQILEAFSGELKNPPGSSRSTAENKLLLLAVRATLRRVLASAKIENIMTISWHSIEEEVARDFEVGKHYIRELRQAFMEDGDVLVYGGVSVD